MIKCPFTFDELFTSKYDCYIKIFIIRNPLYVYSSLNKRFKNTKFDNEHSIDNYIKCIEKFRNIRYNDINNLYFIKYEDLFYNNYENLKNIFNKIGFTYTDIIFDNEKYNNKVQNGKDFEVPKIIPDPTNHTLYRLYQINKQFINNNENSKIYLTKEQINIIQSNENILNIYPNLQNITVEAVII